MKRSIFIFMVLVLLVPLIAGCAGQTPEPAAPAEEPAAAEPVVEAEAEAEAEVEAEPEPEPAEAEAEPEPAAVEEVVADVQDTLVVAQGVDAFSMDPTQHTVKPTGSILFQIYDPLVIQSPDGEMLPGLAETWEQVEPTIWVFHLREGVSFTNGEPMNAEAVAYSINRAVDPATESPYLSRVKGIKEANIIDDYTVEVVTHDPDPMLLRRLVQMSFPMLIVPPKYVSENGDRVPEDAPIGTGPYKFVEWVKDDHLTMEANEDYWGGAPAIKTIIWKPIPETSARISALKNDEIDIAVNISPELADSINSNPGTKISDVSSDYIYFIVFNTETVDAFQNKLVRQALNYAVDVDAILENIMLGFGERVAVTYPTTGFAYPDHLEPRSYDPDKAKELLAEAGYPDGFGPVVFMSRNGRYLKDAEIVQAVAQYLAEVGVETEISFVEGGIWGDLGSEHARGDINFPGWSGTDPDLVWYPVLHCGEFQSYYCNEELDVLLEQGRTSLDQDERAAIYKQAADIIYDDAPHIPLFQPPLIFGLSDNLMWAPALDDIINLRGAYFE
jgi:peptide/nickel transport system substrate-binding protein